MTTPDALKTYLMDGISGSPTVLASLLAGIPQADPAWDRRPDPERFSLREVMAHIADWEDIFLGRLRRMRDEEHPALENMDEGRICADRDYASQDPIANLGRYAKGRDALVAEIRALSPADWERTGNRQFVGDITITQLVTMVLGHDAYHLKQVADYLRS